MAEECVLQYTLVYCDQKVVEAGHCIAIQCTVDPRHGNQARGTARCDTALAPTTRCPAPATRPEATATTQPQRPRHGQACARLGAPGCVAGPAGCALGAPSLFLDSVLFLSHFLGTVHHKNFQKKVK